MCGPSWWCCYCASFLTRATQCFRAKGPRKHSSARLQEAVEREYPETGGGRNLTSSPKPSWGHLGAVLEPSSGRLGAVLGPSWGRLGVLLGALGALLAPLGAILGRFGALLGPFWASLRAKRRCSKINVKHRSEWPSGRPRWAQVGPSWGQVAILSPLEALQDVLIPSCLHLVVFMSS